MDTLKDSIMEFFSGKKSIVELTNDLQKIFHERPGHRDLYRALLTELENEARLPKNLLAAMQGIVGSVSDPNPVVESERIRQVEIDIDEDPTIVTGPRRSFGLASPVHGHDLHGRRRRAG
jgi:hypothetical protein